MTKLRHFHAHVYFEAGQLDTATRLREELGARFPVALGRLHERPVGPHAKAMFQVAFDRTSFTDVVTWLLGNRSGLDVLVHGESGDDLRDHTEHTLWLGTPQPLDLDALA